VLKPTEDVHNLIRMLYAVARMSVDPFVNLSAGKLSAEGAFA